jgi:hypothetical protein
MHCFNHAEEHAVAVCKSCGRGLCHDCTTEVEKAQACKGRCESDLAAMLKINRNSLQLVKGYKQVRYLGPTILMIAGATIATLGNDTQGFDPLTIAGGAVAVFGLVLLIIQHRMAKNLKT